jgi:hypothetical protein
MPHPLQSRINNTPCESTAVNLHCKVHLKFFVVNPQKRSHAKLLVRQDDNIKVSIPKVWFQNLDWIHLAQDWVHSETSKKSNKRSAKQQKDSSY